MPTEQIVQVLVQERDRLSRAIEALKEVPVVVRSAWEVQKRGRRRPMTAAEMKAHSERMRNFGRRGERRNNVE